MEGGFRSVVIQAHWSRLQPDGPGEVDRRAVAALRNRISEAERAGLGVVLELAVQYPPPWALTTIPPYVDQAGRAWTSPTPGMDVRDWVWTSAGRAAVHSFVSETLRALGAVTLARYSECDSAVGYFNELHYPPVGDRANPSWWSYGACVRPAAELSPDQVPCPTTEPPAPVGTWGRRRSSLRGLAHARPCGLHRLVDR